MGKKMIMLILFFCLLPSIDVSAKDSVNLLKDMKSTVYFANGKVKTEDDKHLTDGNYYTAGGVGYGEYVNFVFNRNYDIDRLRVDAMNSVRGVYEMTFYADVDMSNIITSVVTTNNVNTSSFDINVDIKGVRAVKFEGKTRQAGSVRDIYVYGSADVKTDPVLNLSGVSTYNDLGVRWDKPDNVDYEGVIIEVNGKKIGDTTAEVQRYEITNLKPKTVYKVDVIAKYPFGQLADPVSINLTTKSAPNVKNIKIDAKHDNAVIRWQNPTGADFAGVSILKDGVSVAKLQKETKEYAIKGLQPETDYKYEIVSNFSGNFTSDPEIVSFTTTKIPEDAGDVSDLVADPKHNRVDLSWTLPDRDNFKHVNIYRSTLKKSFFDSVLGVKTAMAATPIFETNGTYFNDLTVKEETKYEYTLTTLSEEKVESDGVSIVVTTLKDPKPEIGGGGSEKDPVTGDYTYFWDEPKTGKVKVMVGGKLYATVDAADGKIVIPVDDMKYTFFGEPDVYLIPVDDDGNEGKPERPPSVGGGGGVGNIDLPFGAGDLIKATFDFIRLLGPYILLFLAIWLTPKVVNVIKGVIAKQRQQARRSDG